MSTTIKAYVYETHYYPGFQSGNKKEIWIPSIKAAITQSGEIIENIEEPRNRGHVDTVTHNRSIGPRQWESITNQVYGYTTKIKIVLEKIFVEKIKEIVDAKVALAKSKKKDTSKIKSKLDEDIQKIEADLKAVWIKTMDLFD